jgi:hypothetical protein
MSIDHEVNHSASHYPSNGLDATEGMERNQILTRENVYDPEDKKSLLRRRLTIIAGSALALALTGGAVAFGLNNKDEDPIKTQPRPVATASVDPTPKASTTEKAPVDPTYNENDPKTWTAEHVPLAINVDGQVETYDSVEDLKNNLTLKVDDYPDLYKDPQPFGEGLIKTVNTYLTSINDPTVSENLLKYRQEDIGNPAYGGYIGLGAVLDDFIRPAFEDAIIASPEDGASGLAGGENTDEWLTNLNDFAHTVAKRDARTNGEYDLKYTLDSSVEKSVDYTSGDPSKRTVHVVIYANLADNFNSTDLGSQENVNGGVLEAINQRQRIDMEVQRQEDGGKEVYKIISMHVEQLPIDQ